MKDIVNIKILKNNILALKMNRPIDLDPNKRYEVDIKEYKSKRTLRQNSYLWALITEITKAENGGIANQDNITATYCNLLEKANAKFEFILCSPDAIKEFKKRFRAIRINGTVVIKTVEYTQLQVFYGSSTMNTKEMSQLIDCVLDYAYEVGIEDIDNYWQEILKG